MQALCALAELATPCHAGAALLVNIDWPDSLHIKGRWCRSACCPCILSHVDVTTCYACLRTSCDFLEKARSLLEEWEHGDNKGLLHKLLCI